MTTERSIYWLVFVIRDRDGESMMGLDYNHCLKGVGMETDMSWHVKLHVAYTHTHTQIPFLYLYTD